MTAYQLKAFECQALESNSQKVLSVSAEYSRNNKNIYAVVVYSDDACRDNEQEVLGACISGNVPYKSFKLIYSGDEIPA